MYNVGTFEDCFLKKGMNFFEKMFFKSCWVESRFPTGGWCTDSTTWIDDFFPLPSLVPCRSSSAFPQEFKFWRETDVTLVTFCSNEIRKTKKCGLSKFDRSVVVNLKRFLIFWCVFLPLGFCLETIQHLMAFI